ncbi:substrate-binding periplasmic protein [Pseudodesulfovibrio nedwellii]|uniref:substrate-binding periplasmic protein n=1 Tax=Pseudodesulfovibrio nedwellii TaxID=2973072 RepID=UPI00249309BE|nr:transporter substrate-binding domain-containing protein [Pseudodesulfovibrio nedwellii]
MYKCVFFGCSLLILMLCALPAKAEEVVLAYDEYPPLNYTENGKACGEVIDLIREAGQRLGVGTIFIKRPFVRAIQEVEFRGIDGILGVVKTKERQKYLYYPSTGHTQDGPTLFAHTQSGVKVDSLEDTHGLTVGVIRGYQYGDRVLESLTGEIRPVKDGGTLYKMIAERRFDVGLGYSLSGEYYLKKIPGGDQVKPVLMLPALSLYLAFSKKLGSRGLELAESFSEEIDRIKKERTLMQ